MKVLLEKNGKGLNPGLQLITENSTDMELLQAMQREGFLIGYIATDGEGNVEEAKVLLLPLQK